MKSASIVDLARIPGVGPSIASDLYSLGIREVSDLRGGNPEFLYSELCRKMGQHVDLCLLYVFRCAVYFASESKHDPELLKWWNWKDGSQAALQRACQNQPMNHVRRNQIRTRKFPSLSPVQSRTSPART